jgi:hypothetical protein
MGLPPREGAGTLGLGLRQDGALTCRTGEARRSEGCRLQRDAEALAIRATKRFRVHCLGPLVRRDISPTPISPGHSHTIPIEFLKADPYEIASARAWTGIASSLPVRRDRPRRSGCSISVVAGPRNHRDRTSGRVSDRLRFNRARCIQIVPRRRCCASHAIFYISCYILKDKASRGRLGST